MKKATALCIVILLCFGLAACGGNSETSTSGSGAQESEESIRDLNANQDKTPGDKNTDGAGEGGVILRSDAKNLVQVRIENGEASVQLNAERFDELYDYSSRYEGEIYTGAIKIAGHSGKIKDACVAQIPELDFLNGTDFVTPAIFLLMENGTVEHVIVDFYPHESPVGEFQSEELLWMKDIVSLSYENDGEGIGAMTVYAEDKNGVRYDLRIPGTFCELYSGPWACDMHNAGGCYGVLTFAEDGTVVFEKGWVDEGNPARYTGTFELTIAENADRRPGMMTLDLYLDSSSNTRGNPKEIHGTYFAEVSNLIGLDLWHSDGDYLQTDETAVMEHGEFMLGYNPFDPESRRRYLDANSMIDDYAGYLISTLQEAREKTEVYGMALLDTGEYVEVYGGYYRLISLGTNHADQFVGEIHYAISGDGVIYELDVLNDEWVVQWVPD